MTTRYTNEEWTSIIRQTQQGLAVSTAAVPYAPLGTVGFAHYFDHTLLKLDATGQQIDTLCAEARNYGFRTVCVRLQHVGRAVANLRGKDVGVACVVDFPNGDSDVSSKSREAQQAVAAGATELDVVLNRQHLLTSDYSAAYTEIAAIRSLAPMPTVLKLIVEVSQLTAAAIVAACVLAAHARADFVKTSTGVVGRGATVEDVRLMRAALARVAAAAPACAPAPPLQVKASGAIRDLADAVRMLEAGASRIGASGSVWIMREAGDEIEKRQHYAVHSPAGDGPPRGKIGITRLYSDDADD